MYRIVVPMKSSPKTLLRSPLISLNGEIIIKNKEFGTLHGSEYTPFVNILYAEYSDI